jgi:hypothetical protein
VRTLDPRRLERRWPRGSFGATTVADVSSYERHAPRDPLDPPAIEPGAGSRVD